VVQEVQQPGVGVLGFLDQQHHRLDRREPLEEQPPPGEQFLARQRRPAGAAEADTEQAGQPGTDEGPFAGVRDEPVQPGGQLGGGGFG
jgi:hypothetical protein